MTEANLFSKPILKEKLAENSPIKANFNEQ